MNDFNNTGFIPGHNPNNTQFVPYPTQEPIIYNPNSTLNMQQPNQPTPQNFNFNASRLHVNDMYQQPPTNQQLPYNPNQYNPHVQQYQTPQHGYPLNQNFYQQEYPNTSSSGGYPPNQSQIKFTQVQSNQTSTFYNNDSHDFGDDNSDDLPDYNNNNSSRSYDPNFQQTIELKEKIIIIQNGADTIVKDITKIKVIEFFKKVMNFFTHSEDWMPSLLGRVFIWALDREISNSSHTTHHSSYNEAKDSKKNDRSAKFIIALAVFALAVVVFGSMAGDVEGLNRLEGWETEFHVDDKNLKNLPDVGFDEKKYNSVPQLKLALEGPRLAFKAAKDEILKRMAIKTVSISGLIIGAVGFAVVSEGLAAFGLLLAAGGGVVWLANKVFRPTYMDIMETQMKKLKSDASYALELPMFKSQNSY